MHTFELMFKGRGFSIITFLLFFAITFLVYYFTSQGDPTPYNNFVRLADSFLMHSCTEGYT